MWGNVAEPPRVEGLNNTYGVLIYQDNRISHGLSRKKYHIVVIILIGAEISTDFIRRLMSGSVKRCLDKRDGISAGDLTTPDHPGEYPLPGHNAIAGLVINGAGLMAGLADLRDFDDDCRSQSHLCPYQPSCFQSMPSVATFSAKSPKFTSSPFSRARWILSEARKTHLTMPGAGVGIPVQTMVENYPGPVHQGFSGSFFPADGNRYDLHDSYHVPISHPCDEFCRVPCQLPFLRCIDEE
jgi:hypothetical protein